MDKRMIISVNFRDGKDEELYNFVLRKGKVIGNSNYIKQLIYEQLEREKAGK